MEGYISTLALYIPLLPLESSLNPSLFLVYLVKADTGDIAVLCPNPDPYIRLLGGPVEVLSVEGEVVGLVHLDPVLVGERVELGVGEDVHLLRVLDALRK